MIASLLLSLGAISIRIARASLIQLEAGCSVINCSSVLSASESLFCFFKANAM
jgi:hypothetical protein